MVDSKDYTLLMAPMSKFYREELYQDSIDNPGRTQMRIAYVEDPKEMMKVPGLLKGLLQQYQSKLIAQPQKYLRKILKVVQKSEH